MLSIRLDPNSALTVRWPTKDDDIIALGEKWVIYEASRSAASQLKDLTLVRLQTKLDAAKAARALAQSGEAVRTLTAGEYRTALTTIRAHLDRALTYLKYKHAANLLPLEQWGWNVRHTARGGLTVRMPGTDAALLLLLETYVAHESTLGAAQQIADPSLTTMQALLVDVKDYAQNRDAGKVKRTANIVERSTAARDLLNLLQGAALVICLLEFGGQVHATLGNWGYTLVAATPPQPGDPPTEEPPVA